LASQDKHVFSWGCSERGCRSSNLGLTVLTTASLVELSPASTAASDPGEISRLSSDAVGDWLVSLAYQYYI